MASDRAFIDKVVEDFLPLEVRAKAMFGEYGLYHQGKMFGVVCDNTLFIKETVPGAALASRIAKASPHPGAKPAFKVSAAKLGDRDWLIALVRATSDALPTPKPGTTRR